MSAGGFELTGGFWFGLLSGDCNSDGQVDLIDFQGFAGCVTGPDVEEPLPFECRCYDLDLDDDVDLIDFKSFQIAFGG